MKVLITGGTGLVGEKLAKKLADKKHKITIMSSRESYDSPYKFISANVLNKAAVSKAVKGQDCVIHLAACLDESLPIDQLFNINVDGTFNVFDACLENEVKKIIYTSSVGIYGQLKEMPGTEKSPMLAFSPYERSKKEIELYIPEYKEKGLPIVTIRPTIIYGAGSNMFNNLIGKIEKGSFYIGNGKNKWPLVYVDDVVDGIILALENDKIIGEDFIISDNQAYRYKDIVKVIKKHLGKVAPTPRIPLGVLNMMAGLNGIAHKVVGVPHVVTKAKVARFVRNREFSIEKAKNLLSYEPKVSLNDGMKETVEGYLQSKS
jgi:nucleoside-diphosphate-sugar epimerase